MHRWYAEAAPLIDGLMRTEDDALDLRGSSGPALTAACDQLEAAANHCEKWLHHHGCPDADLGAYFELLICACSAIAKMLSPELYLDPKVRSKIDTYLLDRISMTVSARAVLLGHR